MLAVTCSLNGFKLYNSKFGLRLSDGFQRGRYGLGAGGNYWVNYSDNEAGTASFIIDKNNRDNYPLMSAAEMPVQALDTSEWYQSPFEAQFIIELAVVSLVLAVAVAGLILFVKKRHKRS